MKKIFCVGLFICTIACGFAQPESADFQGTGLTFNPDYTFTASTLDGWRPMGSAHWSAKGGEVAGTIHSGVTNGLLLLDRSFQDTGIHVAFCGDTNAEIGIALRLEKSNEGMKAILVSIKNDTLLLNRVTFDPSGHELHREELPLPPANANLS